jgi:Cu/Ag efflux protein CusF
MSRSTHKSSRLFVALTLLTGFASFDYAQAQAMNTMPGMGKSDQKKEQKSEQKTASGTGTVTALNAAAKKITLDHTPIAAINWPAMKMEFPTASSVDLSKVKVGDKVQFTLTGSGNDYTVQSVKPAQ